jgi:transcriptional regulator with XRE-family HTH domain
VARLKSDPSAAPTPILVVVVATTIVSELTAFGIAIDSGLRDLCIVPQFQASRRWPEYPPYSSRLLPDASVSLQISTIEIESQWNITMLIGQIIRRLREQKGFSQGDIERQTDIPHCYISRVEHGHIVPCLKTLERLAAALDTPMYRLFYNAEDGALPVAVGGRPTPETLENLAQSTGPEGSEARFLLQLKGLTRNMSKSDRTLLLALARRFADHR